MAGVRGTPHKIQVDFYRRRVWPVHRAVLRACVVLSVTLSLLSFVGLMSLSLVYSVGLELLNVHFVLSLNTLVWLSVRT